METTGVNAAVVRELLDALRALPPEQVAEVRDFALFLRARYGGLVDGVDEGNAWSEEDVRDLVAASIAYAEGQD